MSNLLLSRSLVDIEQFFKYIHSSKSLVADSPRQANHRFEIVERGFHFGNHFFGYHAMTAKERTDIKALEKRIRELEKQLERAQI